MGFNSGFKGLIDCNSQVLVGNASQKTTMYEKLKRLLIDRYDDGHHYCLFTAKIYCTYCIEKLKLDFSLK